MLFLKDLLDKIFKTETTGKGIFSAIIDKDKSNYGTDILEFLKEFKNIDFLHYYLYSKKPLTNLGLSLYNERLSLENFAQMCIDMYSDKWIKLYNVLLKAEYKPLDNYSMTENETTTGTSDSKNNSATSVQTSNENSMAAFNSDSEYVSQTKSQATQKGSKEQNETTLNTNANQDIKLTRSGNIGVTTSQQMLQSEIDLRQKNNYLKILFDDINFLICLSVY